MEISQRTQFNIFLLYFQIKILNQSRIGPCLIAWVRSFTLATSQNRFYDPIFMGYWLCRLSFPLFQFNDGNVLLILNIPTGYHEIDSARCEGYLKFYRYLGISWNITVIE